MEQKSSDKINTDKTEWVPLTAEYTTTSLYNALSPTLSQHSLSPIPAQNILSPILSQPSLSQHPLSPTLSQHSLSPTLSQHVLSPTLSQYALSPTLSQHPISPTLSQHPISPTLSQHSLTPTLSQHPISSMLSQHALSLKLSEHTISPSTSPIPSDTEQHSPQEGDENAFRIDPVGFSDSLEEQYTVSPSLGTRVQQGEEIDIRGEQSSAIQSAISEISKNFVGGRLSLTQHPLSEGEEDSADGSSEHRDITNGQYSHRSSSSRSGTASWQSSVIGDMEDNKGADMGQRSGEHTEEPIYIIDHGSEPSKVDPTNPDIRTDSDPPPTYHDPIPTDSQDDTIAFSHSRNRISNISDSIATDQKPIGQSTPYIVSTEDPIAKIKEKLPLSKPQQFSLPSLTTTRPVYTATEGATTRPVYSTTEGATVRLQPLKAEHGVLGEKESHFTSKEPSNSQGGGDSSNSSNQGSSLSGTSSRTGSQSRGSHSAGDILDHSSSYSKSKDSVHSSVSEPSRRPLRSYIVYPSDLKSATPSTAERSRDIVSNASQNKSNSDRPTSSEPLCVDIPEGITKRRVVSSPDIDVLSDVLSQPTSQVDVGNVLGDELSQPSSQELSPYTGSQLSQRSVAGSVASHASQDSLANRVAALLREPALSVDNLLGVSEKTEDQSDLSIMLLGRSDLIDLDLDDDPVRRTAMSPTQQYEVLPERQATEGGIPSDADPVQRLNSFGRWTGGMVSDYTGLHIGDLPEDGDLSTGRQSTLSQSSVRTSESVSREVQRILGNLEKPSDLYRQGRLSPTGSQSDATEDTLANRVQKLLTGASTNRSDLSDLEAPPSGSPRSPERESYDSELLKSISVPMGSGLMDDITGPGELTKTKTDISTTVGHGLKSIDEPHRSAFKRTNSMQSVNSNDSISNRVQKVLYKTAHLDKTGSVGRPHEDDQQELYSKYIEPNLSPDSRQDSAISVDVVSNEDLSKSQNDSNKSANLGWDYGADVGIDDAQGRFLGTIRDVPRKDVLRSEPEGVSSLKEDRQTAPSVPSSQDSSQTHTAPSVHASQDTSQLSTDGSVNTSRRQRSRDDHYGSTDSLARRVQELLEDESPTKKAAQILKEADQTEKPQAEDNRSYIQYPSDLKSTTPEEDSGDLGYHDLPSRVAPSTQQTPYMQHSMFGSQDMTLGLTPGPQGSFQAFGTATTRLTAQLDKLAARKFDKSLISTPGVYKETDAERFIVERAQQNQHDREQERLRQMQNEIARKTLSGTANLEISDGATPLIPSQDTNRSYIQYPPDLKSVTPPVFVTRTVPGQVSRASTKSQSDIAVTTVSGDRSTRSSVTDSRLSRDIYMRDNLSYHGRHVEAPLQSDVYQRPPFTRVAPRGQPIESIGREVGRPIESIGREVGQPIESIGRDVGRPIESVGHEVHEARHRGQTHTTDSTVMSRGMRHGSDRLGTSPVDDHDRMSGPITSTQENQRQTPVQRRISPRPRSSSPILRPYRPRGSPEVYYILDDGRTLVDDSNMSVTNTETTMESTHTGSDDAIAPYIPPHAMGSRRDEMMKHPTGIYGSKRSPKSTSPPPAKLTTITEGKPLMDDKPIIVDNDKSSFSAARIRQLTENKPEDSVRIKSVQFRDDLWSYSDDKWAYMDDKWAYRDFPAPDPHTRTKSQDWVRERPPSPPRSQARSHVSHGSPVNYRSRSPPISTGAYRSRSPPKMRSPQEEMEKDRTRQPERSRSLPDTRSGSYRSRSPNRSPLSVSALSPIHSRTPSPPGRSHGPDVFQDRSYSENMLDHLTTNGEYEQYTPLEPDMDDSLDIITLDDQIGRRGGQVGGRTATDRRQPVEYKESHRHPQHQQVTGKRQTTDRRETTDWREIAKHKQQVDRKQTVDENVDRRQMVDRRKAEAYRQTKHNSQTDDSWRQLSERRADKKEDRRQTADGRQTQGHGQTADSRKTKDRRHSDRRETEDQRHQNTDDRADHYDRHRNVYKETDKPESRYKDSHQHRDREIENRQKAMDRRDEYIEHDKRERDKEQGRMERHKESYQKGSRQVHHNRKEDHHESKISEDAFSEDSTITDKDRRFDNVLENPSQQFVQRIQRQINKHEKRHGDFLDETKHVKRRRASEKENDPTREGKSVKTKKGEYDDLDMEHLHKVYYPADPKLIKIKQKIKKQKERHAREKLKEQKRKDKILQLEQILRESQKTGTIDESISSVSTSSTFRSTTDSSVNTSSGDLDSTLVSKQLTPVPEGDSDSTGTYTVTSEDSVVAASDRKPVKQKLDNQTHERNTDKDKLEKYRVDGRREPTRKSGKDRHKDTPVREAYRSDSAYFEFKKPDRPAPKVKPKSKEKVLKDKPISYSPGKEHKTGHKSHDHKSHDHRSHDQRSGEQKTQSHRSERESHGHRHAGHRHQHPRTRDVAVMYPSPMLKTPPRMSDGVVMVSEAVQTTPSDLISDKRISRSRRDKSKMDDNGRGFVSVPVTPPNKHRATHKSASPSRYGDTYRSPSRHQPTCSSPTRYQTGSPSRHLSPSPSRHDRRDHHHSKKGMSRTKRVYTPESPWHEEITKEKPTPLTYPGGFAWYVPLNESRPWRMPMRERQMYAKEPTWRTIPTSRARGQENHAPGHVSQTWRTIPTSRARGQENHAPGHVSQYRHVPPPSVPLTLQEAFELSRGNLISRSRERVRRMQLASEERKITHDFDQEREKLFSPRKKKVANPEAHPYSDNLHKPKKREMEKVEIKERTEKLYQQLPEVTQKIHDKKREEQYKTNRVRAQMYKNKILNKVLNKKTAPIR